MKPDNTSKYAANRFSIAPMLDGIDAWLKLLILNNLSFNLVG